MKHTQTLSKSDFILASSCPKKLHYKKQAYPSNSTDNEFLQMLAEGGYVVGKLAQLHYPDGIEITGNTQEALKQTAELLEQEHVILFEAIIQSGQKLVRIDILKKNGNHFDLIEVKSKSFDSTSDDFLKIDSNGRLKKKNEPYVFDAIYQTIVLEEAYPNATIDTFLMLPDKSVENTVEGFPKYFTTKIHHPENKGGFRSVEVIFEESVEANQALAEVKKMKLMNLLDISKPIELFRQEVQNMADEYISYLNSDFKNYTPQLDKECKKCEFRFPEGENKNGFAECWGKNAFVSPHIFDLYFGGTLGGYELLNDKIRNGKVSLFDIQLEELVGSDGKIGTRNERQIIQCHHTQSQTEYPETAGQKEDFKSNFKQAFKFPLHFIDFETMLSAIPFHRQLKPYEMFPFQFSVHTLYEDGRLEHHEFINDDLQLGYPGFRFAEELMKVVGHTGTPLMWSSHENTTLKGVLKQMDVRNYHNENLKSWLTEITREKKEDRKGRFVDMNDFALKNYFHPDMKGQTSIKKVLPAIWFHNEYLYEIEHFKEWVIQEDGQVLDPYKRLKDTEELWGFSIQPSDVEEDETNTFTVNDGGAAMKAYQDMIFTQNPERKSNLKKQLLKYCELDTLAMVIIYTHWEKIALG